MVRQVTALLAHELVMQAAVGHVAATVVRAEGKLFGTRVLLVRLLLFMVLLCSIVIIVELARVLADCILDVGHCMRQSLHTGVSHLLIQVARALIAVM